MTELRTATDVGTPADTMLIPIAKAATGTGLFQVTLAALKAYFLAGGSGSGVPDGGTTGQVLGKLSDDDGDADWIDMTGGGGGAGPTSLVLTGVALLNGFTEYGGGFSNLKATKIGRLVTITGMIKGGASGAIAFNMPVGWRPEEPFHSSGDSLGRAAPINIYPDGNVTIADENNSDIATYVGMSFQYIVSEADAYDSGGGGGGGGGGIAGTMLAHFVSSAYVGEANPLPGMMLTFTTTEEKLVKLTLNVRFDKGGNFGTGIRAGIADNGVLIDGDPINSSRGIHSVFEDGGRNMLNAVTLVTLPAGDHVLTVPWQHFGNTEGLGIAFRMFLAEDMTDVGEVGGGGGGGNSGNAFPGAPSNGQRFFRTDRGIEYYWNGTLWLSTQLFSYKMWEYLDLSAAEWQQANRGNLAYGIPYRGKYSIFLTEFQVNMLHTNPSQSFRFACNKVGGGFLFDVTQTFDGSYSNNVYYTQITEINALLDAQAHYLTFATNINQYGTFDSSYFYRLVG